MKSAISILGHLIASHDILGRTRPDATPDSQRKLSIIGKLKPSRWTQGPPLALLSNHIRRDIGLEPVPARDRWHDHRF